MKLKALRYLACLLAVLMLAQTLFVLNIFATSGTEDASEEDLSHLLMADEFKFQLPGEDATNLLSEDVEFAGTFSTGAILNVFMENNKIDLATTAYVTYKVKNNSDQTLSLGSLIYFSTTGGACCGFVTVPLVYDAQTGEKLDVRTSYEYNGTTNQFVLSNVLPTYELPAGTEAYVAIPFTSTNHSTNYLPGMPKTTDPFVVGTMPAEGVLWSNNAERTKLMENKIARDGTTDCFQLQVFLGGNGADANGNRTYSGNYDFTISEYVAVSKEAYFAYATAPDVDEPETETTETETPETETTETETTETEAPETETTETETTETTETETTETETTETETTEAETTEAESTEAESTETESTGAESTEESEITDEIETTPVVTPDTDKDTDKDTDDEVNEDGGCGSSIALPAVIVLMLACTGAFFAKKKED